MNTLRCLKILQKIKPDLTILENQSNCFNKHIGAYLIDSHLEGYVMSCGFNNYPENSCMSSSVHSCPRYLKDVQQTECPAIHAEVSTILNYLQITRSILDYSLLTSDRNNRPFNNKEVVVRFKDFHGYKNYLDECIMYCTYTPCPDCLELLEYLGITDIFCKHIHYKTVPQLTTNIWIVDELFTEAKILLYKDCKIVEKSKNS